jgi:threonine/homoserine/homoserine lactone efflux protein
MNLEIVLPITVMFFVWGIKPGPHTITLMFRSISHGAKAGIAIATGNNICHLLYFWLAFSALRLFSENQIFLEIGRVGAGVYIIIYSMFDAFKDRGSEAKNQKKTYWGTIAAGFVIGLMNPLNASFYLGVVPELIEYQFSFADKIVVSFIVFFSLLSGQMIYVGFSDFAKSVFSVRRYRSAIYLVSNVLFCMIGVYILFSALGNMTA